ncbi:MAG: hypothetical protein ACRENU_12745, partial [Gemmatimonadaceae bacterium]
GAHLDTQEQLARHNKENHIRGATGMERPRQKGSEGSPPDQSEQIGRSRRSSGDSSSGNDRRF